MAKKIEVIDQALKEWATPTQAAHIDAVNKHGSISAAAKHLKINTSSVSRSLKSCRRLAAAMGYSPDHDMTRPVPFPFKTRGVSTLYDKDGKIRVQWVKSQLDEQKWLEALEEFAHSLANGIKPVAPIAPPQGLFDADLLSVYPMGDPHFGMYAWWQESGEDFDLKIAERITCAAIDRLVSNAPPSHTGLLLNLGDMFHADNQNNTSQSGHQLDVDGRWAKVQQVGLQAMIHGIYRLLEKHQRVIVRINKGNHDGHSSYALALMISCYFQNEPRVEVDLSPAVAWYYRFGKVLIGSTHGDTIKGPDMVSVMAADKPVEWGETTHRYWYVGHVHHQDTKEYRGGVVEYFRTLAARDAWHAGQGYRAGRDMRLIVLHKDHGEIERHRCDIGMVEA